MITDIKILLLEDISADAELVKRELEKGNIQYEILVVDNKPAFINAIEAFAPNIILANHTLPSFDSFEAIEILNKTGIHVPVILVSTKVSDEFTVEIMKAGAVDYIFKDRLHRLPKAVVNALAKFNADQKLREIETLNKVIISTLNAHIAVIDRSGVLITSNNAWDDFAKSNGITSLERVSAGSNYFAVCEQAIASGDIFAAQALAGIKSIFKNKSQVFEMEYPCHSSAQQRWFLLNAVNFGNDENKIVLSHQDITERKIAENELKKTSSELQKTLAERNKILDSSLDVICTINTNGEFVNVSAASKEIWGFTPEELIGTSFMDLVYAEDVEMTAKATETIVAGNNLPIFENRYVHKKGKTVPILWSVNWDEEFHLMYCTAKDVTEKKYLEKAIENERDQFYEMFSNAPSAIGMLKGPDHIFEMANPFYLETIGKKDVIGKPLVEVLPELDGQGVIKILNHIYQTGESYSGKELLVKVDVEGKGEFVEFYKDFVYQAYRNGEGEILGVFCFINDITEQVVSKKKIEKKEKQYRQIVETANEGIWQLDEKCRTTFVNKKMCEMLGYSEEEIIGKENYFFMDSGGKEKALSALERRKSGVAENIEYIFISKKGEKVITNVSANPIFDENGNFGGSLGMVSDITEKKMADENISFKANLLNTISQAAIATNLDGVITYWNKAAENIYGWTAEEAIGKNIMYLTASNATRKEALEIMESLKKGVSWTGEFRVQRKDGTNFPAIVANSPIYDDDSKLTGIIGISTDISEKKKLEALLDKSNRLARIGSWEIDVEKGTVYWSDITKEIREAEPDFEPNLKTGIGFFREGISRKTISQRVQQCIDEGIPWDEELQITTFKGNEKWVRTIGEAEFFNGKCIKVYGSFQDIDKLKNTEIRIRESEFRYRQIVETAQEGIWMLDENNETTFVNKKMCDIIGYSCDEMMGKTNFFFKDEAGLQTASDSLKRRKEGISETYRASFITKDKRLIWTQISSNPIFDDAKIYKGSLWMVSDITEQLMADKLLLESEQKYRKIASELEKERIRFVKAQSVAKVGSWETDLQTYHVNWSDEMHRLYGTDINDFEPSYSKIQNLVHIEDRETIDKAFVDSLQHDNPNSLEHRIITIQGVEKWVEQNWTISRDDNGLPILAVGTCQDITESKNAADKIARSEIKLQAAQQIAQVGSYEVDMITEAQKWSDEFYRILGINKKIIPSREVFLSFIHPDDRDMALNSMMNALSQHLDSSFNFRFIRPNGETGFASSEWKFEFDSQGKPLYILGILRDLTKEKETESERIKMISDIIQRNSDLEQFSYIVSHNLRAPAANIMGFAGILQDETLTLDEQKESLQGLSASVTGLDSVIKDINIILQSKREVHEKKEIVVFSQLVESIKIGIGNLIEKHHVQIVSDFSELEKMYSLKIYIYSIFFNLISNSIKYGKPNQPPIIEIKSSKEKGKIILTFKDNGLGMDLKTKEDKIFGLYNRFHSHVEGKGMGLFMVKTQVESLGGKISISSELNKGTEFKIEFEN